MGELVDSNFFTSYLWRYILRTCISHFPIGNIAKHRLTIHNAGIYRVMSLSFWYSTVIPLIHYWTWLEDVIIISMVMFILP